MSDYKPACFRCGAIKDLRPYRSLLAGTLGICPNCVKSKLDRNKVAEYARLLKQAQRLPETARNRARLIATLQAQLEKAKAKIGK